MLLGDFNFRNKIWADSVTNKYGELLEDYIGKNNLACITPNTCSSKNQIDSSIIDLALTSPSVAGIYNSTSVDSNIELFSGAL